MGILALNKCITKEKKSLYELLSNFNPVCSKSPPILLMHSILSHNGDVFKIVFFEVLHYVYKLERIVKLVSFPVLPDVRELTRTLLASVAPLI